MKLLTESVTTNPSTTTPPTARPGSPKTDWRLYAAAGTATLAATSAADASIIYTPINLSFVAPTVTAVPDPTRLGLLAIASTGLLTWWRRRNAPASAT